MVSYSLGPHLGLGRSHVSDGCNHPMIARPDLGMVGVLGTVEVSSLGIDVVVKGSEGVVKGIEACYWEGENRRSNFDETE